MPLCIFSCVRVHLIALAALAGVASSGWAQPATSVASPQTRWITGSTVNLRAQASTSAPVVMRLRGGTPVTLLESAPSPASGSTAPGGVTFCVVQTQLTAQRGFVACEFLSAKPPGEASVNATSGASAAPAPAPASSAPAPLPALVQPPALSVAKPASAPAPAIASPADAAPATGPAASTSERRFINASGVNLRAQASTSAQVLARLSQNTQVQLLSTQPDGVFCDVVVGVGAQRGFVACQYLEARLDARLEARLDARLETRLDARLQARDAEARASDPATATAPEPTAIKPSSGAPLERAFWQEPTPLRLFVFGKYLEQTRLSPEQKAAEQDARPVEFVAKPQPILLRPKVREFEAMKARLAQGVVGTTPPAPLLAWRDLQKAFAAAEADIAQARKTSKLLVQRDQPWQYLQPGQTAFEAKLAGLVGTPATRRPAKGAEVSAAVAPSALSTRVAGLALVMDKIELPPAAPSFFKSWADIAPPAATVPELSAKWGMPYTLETQPGPRWVSNSRNGISQIAGSWDIGRAVVQLASPVVRLSIARDGQVVAGVSGLNSVVLDDKDAFGSCQLGFRYGDAGVDLLNPNVNYTPEDLRSANPTLIRLFLRNPAATLATNATIKATPVTLSETETGFTAAEQITIDLNADGIPDLVVWEGTGQPHDSIYTPQRLDPYFRVYAINLAGVWYLLGRDEFVYGCG